MAFHLFARFGPNTCSSQCHLAAAIDGLYGWFFTFVPILPGIAFALSFLPSARWLRNVLALGSLAAAPMQVDLMLLLHVRAGQDVRAVVECLGTAAVFGLVALDTDARIQPASGQVLRIVCACLLLAPVMALIVSRQ